MTHLHKQQLNTLGELLDAREQALKSDMLEHVDRLRADNEPGMTPPPSDAADQTDLKLLRDNENDVVVREVRELRSIEAAKARLAEGVAGKCSDCGGEIPFARLKAQPTATRCLPCQRRYEQTHAAAPAGLRDELGAQGE